MAVIPHFRVPFQIGAFGAAVVVEQNSLTDIGKCVEAIVKTRVGQRAEVPGFGIPDLTFTTDRSAAGDVIAAQIEAWEPRAEIEVTSRVSPSDDSQRNLTVLVKAKAEVVNYGVLDAMATSTAVVTPTDPTTPVDPGTPDPTTPATWSTLGSITWNQLGDATWNSI
jgi:predicted component of type VI protein secretion system